jgi:hypothetical protein
VTSNTQISVRDARNRALAIILGPVDVLAKLVNQAVVAVARGSLPPPEI